MSSKNVRKTLKKKVRKGLASSLKISHWGSFFSACANQPPSFYVSGISTPNGLFQTINELTHSVPVLPSYRDQSIALHSQSTDWFLHKSNTGIYWVKKM